MASGKLGSAALAANADTTLSTCPAGKVQTISVAFCNRGAAIAKIRLAIGGVANPADTDFIDYDLPIYPSRAYERTGIALSPGEKVIVRADTATVSVRVHGFEEDL